MPQNKRVRMLLALLERTGFGWLADELRWFSDASRLPVASPGQILQARILSKVEAMPRGELELPTNSDDMPIAKYSDYLRYIELRLSSIAAALRASADVLQELGPEGVCFGIPTSELATGPQSIDLRRTADEIDVMVELLTARVRNAE